MSGFTNDCDLHLLLHDSILSFGILSKVTCLSIHIHILIDVCRVHCCSRLTDMKQGLP